MLISYYNAPIKNTKPAFSIKPEKIIKRIESDTYKKITDELRGIDDKEEKKTHKARNFPYVTWSGVFSERKDSKLDVYSGLITVDIDGINDINPLRKEINKDLYVFFSFVSPSGKGLKIIIKTNNKQPEEHKNYWYAIEKHFFDKYKIKIDSSGKDLSRACFLCYDPDVYYNNDAIIWIDKKVNLESTISKVSKKKLDKDELYNLNLDKLDESLSKYNVKDCGDYYTFDCPRCGRSEAFLYKNNFQLLCSHKNSCGYEESLLDREIEKKIGFLKKNKKSRKLKNDIYKHLTKLSELEQEQYFNILKNILEVRLAVIQKDYKYYSKENINAKYKVGEIEFLLPSGYTMNNNGIFLDERKITYYPCYISAVGESSEDGTEYARLEYKSNMGQKKRVIKRSEYTITGDFLALTKFGVPVSSANSLDMIKFNEAWSSINNKIFPKFEVNYNIGWDKDKLVLPDRLISENGTNRDVVYYGNINSDAYKQKGNLKDWVGVIKLLGALKKGHIVRFLILAGFASVILEPLNLRPFIIHLHGDSSVGKSTVLKLVASIFGRPEEGYALIRWKNTHNFIIRYIENLKNLPLVIDELSTENRQNHDDLLYMFESKIGKGKASKSDPHSIVKQKSFNTGMFSSGERPILADQSLTGAQVRVWEFSDLPFGEIDKNGLIAEIEKMRMSHFGVALEPYLQCFFKNRDTIFKTDKTFYKDGPLNNVESRLLKALNPIYQNAILVNELFNFEWDVDADFNKIFSLIREPFMENNQTVDDILSEIRGEYAENSDTFFEIGINDNGKQCIKEKDYRGKVRSGYKYGNDLWWIKTSFMRMWNKKKGKGTGGKYAIERLLEKGYIESKKSKRSVEGSRVDVIIFPSFFESEDENDQNDFI